MAYSRRRIVDSVKTRPPLSISLANPGANSDLPIHGQFPRTQVLHSCHEIVSTEYGEPRQQAASVIHSLYHRSLFTLTDVIYIFIEDIGGTDIAI